MPPCVSVHVAAAYDQESADREEEINPKAAGVPARTVSVARRMAGPDRDGGQAIEEAEHFCVREACVLLSPRCPHGQT